MSLLRKFPKEGQELEINFDPKIEFKANSMFETAVSDIIQRAQKVYLNDISGITYNTALLLPFIKDAYEEFQLELELHNVSSKSTFEFKTIPAGSNLYAPLPPLFVWPEKMEERKSGTADSFTPMFQRDFESNTPTSNILGFYCFREDGIHLPDASEDRQVLLYYKKAFPEINDDNDVVFGRSKSYLAAKISAMALHLIAQNNTLADSCNTKAEEHLKKLVKVYNKMDQGIPYRSIPFKSYGW